MENPVIISNLNDFIFCPVSIYFHNLYGETSEMLYQSHYQINGKDAHKAIEEKTYKKARTLKSLSVYSEKYNLLGKIDIYETDTKTLIERKKKISKIFDGQVFQLYGQCLAMREMGYEVCRIRIHSLDDNKNYEIPLPENDEEMMNKFIKLLQDISEFDMDAFIPTSKAKCSNCIYSTLCDRSLADD